MQVKYGTGERRDENRPMECTRDGATQENVTDKLGTLSNNS